MSFICLLLYIFCTIIRPQDWVPAFYGMPLINYLAIATAFFLLLEQMGRGQNILMKVPQNGMIFGLFFSIIMSHVFHSYLGGVIDSFNRFIIIFILFFLVLNGVNSEFKFKAILWFIVVLVVILVPQGVYQLKHGYGWGGQELTFDPERDEYRINWVGIFNDPNDLALLFVVAVGVCLAFAFGKKTNFIARVINFFFLSQLFHGIFMTNSRGGYLALLATVYFFFIRKAKKFYIGGIIGGILVFALFAIGPSRLGIISFNEDSAATRVELWYQGFLMFKYNPVFGVGFDMFMEDTPQTAHNSFVLAFAELGFVGLFFWMALIYTSFKGLSMIIASSDKRLYNYAMGLQVGLIGFCAAAFFLSRTYVVLPYLLFALSGSLMYVAKLKNKELDFRFTKKDFRNVFYLSVGTIAVVYAFIKTGL